MIRLTKGPIPDILVEKAQAWTDVLLARLAGGESPTATEKGRYRHPDVKAALIAETHGKCAYCESKVRHITHGDIDHIIPKSKAPEKAFKWENLTLACDLCNEKKSDYFGDQESFVDPYVVNPDAHLFFEGPMLLPVPGSDPGLLTETVLQLNRSDLLERRREKILSLSKQVEVLARTSDQALRAVVRQDILKNELAAAQEFAGMARHCVSILLAKLDEVKQK